MLPIWHRLLQLEAMVGRVLCVVVTVAIGCRDPTQRRRDQTHFVGGSSVLQLPFQP